MKLSAHRQHAGGTSVETTTPSSHHQASNSSRHIAPATGGESSVSFWSSFSVVESLFSDEPGRPTGSAPSISSGDHIHSSGPLNSSYPPNVPFGQPNFLASQGFREDLEGKGHTLPIPSAALKKENNNNNFGYGSYQQASPHLSASSWGGYDEDQFIDHVFSTPNDSGSFQSFHQFDSLSSSPALIDGDSKMGFAQFSPSSNGFGAISKKNQAHSSLPSSLSSSPYGPILGHSPGHHVGVGQSFEEEQHIHDHLENLRANSLGIGALSTSLDTALSLTLPNAPFTSISNGSSPQGNGSNGYAFSTKKTSNAHSFGQYNNKFRNGQAKHQSNNYYNVSPTSNGASNHNSHHAVPSYHGVPHHSTSSVTVSPTQVHNGIQYGSRSASAHGPVSRSQPLPRAHIGQPIHHMHAHINSHTQSPPSRSLSPPMRIHSPPTRGGHLPRFEASPHSQSPPRNKMGKHIDPKVHDGLTNGAKGMAIDSRNNDICWGDDLPSPKGLSPTSPHVHVVSTPKPKINYSNAYDQKESLLLHLPSSTLLRMCSFLGVADLAVLEQVCKKRLNHFATDDGLWKQLYMKRYKLLEIPQDGLPPPPTDQTHNSDSNSENSADEWAWIYSLLQQNERWKDIFKTRYSAELWRIGALKMFNGCWGFISQQPQDPSSSDQQPLDIFFHRKDIAPDGEWYEDWWLKDTPGVSRSQKCGYWDTFLCGRIVRYKQRAAYAQGRRPQACNISFVGEERRDPVTNEALPVFHTEARNAQRALQAATSRLSQQ